MQDRLPTSTETHKHNNWNGDLDLYKMFRSFTIPSASSVPIDMFANFNEMHEVTFGTHFVDGSTTINFEFRDPWYVESGVYDQPDDYAPQQNGYTPTGHWNMPQGGLMSEMGYKEYHPTFPYYAMRVPWVLDANKSPKNPATVALGDWICYGMFPDIPGGAVLQRAGANYGYPLYQNYYTRSIGLDNQGPANSIGAEYQGHLMSYTASTPTNLNSQRKVAFESGRHETSEIQHAVYESDGKVFYMRSTNNGASWEPEHLVSSFYQTASMPSVATSYNGWVDAFVGGEMPRKTEYTNVVYVCYLEYDDARQVYEVILKYKAADDPDDGSWTEIDRIQAPSDCTPVLASPMPDGTALTGGESSSCVLVWNDQSELKYSIYVNAGTSAYNYQPLQSDVTGQGQIETYRAKTLATGRLVQGSSIPPKYPSISSKAFRYYNRDLFVTWNENRVQKMISLGYHFAGQVSVGTTVTVGSPLTITPPSVQHRIASYASPSLATHLADPVFVYEQEYPILTAPRPSPYPIPTTLAYTPYTYGTKAYYTVASPYPTIPWLGLIQFHDWRNVFGCKMQYNSSGSYSWPRWWSFQRRMNTAVSRLNPIIASKSKYHLSDNLVMAMNEATSGWLSTDIDMRLVAVSNIAQRDGIDPATNFSGDVVACNASLTASSPFTHRINSYSLQKATVTSMPVMKQVYVSTADSAFAKYGIVMPHVRTADNELTEIAWAAEPDTAIDAEPYSIEDMAKTEPFSVSDGFAFEYATDMYAFHPEEFAQQFAYEMKFYDNSNDSLLKTDRILLSDLPSDTSMYVVYRINISDLSGRTVYMAMGLSDTTDTMVSNLVRVALLDDLSTEKVTAENALMPTSVTLYQNYPNPFNPTTYISFYLPGQMKFKLEIFNSLGVRVKLLEDGWRDTGKHTVQFDASSLPGGVYYYKLSTGEQVITNPMTLVK